MFLTFRAYLIENICVTFSQISEFRWTRHIPDPWVICLLPEMEQSAYLSLLVNELVLLCNDNLDVLHESGTSDTIGFQLIMNIAELCFAARYWNPERFVNVIKCIDDVNSPYPLHFTLELFHSEDLAFLEYLFEVCFEVKYDVYGWRKNHRVGVSRMADALQQMIKAKKMNVLFFVRNGYTFPVETLSVDENSEFSSTWKSVKLMEILLQSFNDTPELRHVILAHVEATTYPIARSCTLAQFKIDSELVEAYEEAVPDLANGIEEPRSLKHLARCASRHQLFMCFNLQNGIEALNIPGELKSYLRLTADGNFDMKKLI